ncbi:MAG: PD40 domain-containing protein [Anaerolineales bacterium]|nr:PD40 domain-containing protein [Anaerolineales bacterium]
MISRRFSKFLTLPALFLLSIAVMLTIHSALAVQGETTRVSLANRGLFWANDSSFAPEASSDGRYVVFHSRANNLVLGDANGMEDIFVYDRQTGFTTLASVASDGSQANGDSGYAHISADGRFVVFDTFATNLVPGDTNNARDVFVHDRQTGLTTRVSVASDGTEGNDSSTFGSLSADGQYVTFYSRASNLVPGDTNSTYDNFLYDRETGITTRISVASNGTEGNDSSTDAVISADGHWAVFASDADNLVNGDTNGVADIFLRDLQNNTTARVSIASNSSQANGGSYVPVLSSDGRWIAFASEADNLTTGDTNLAEDIFVHDRLTGTTTRISVASDGIQGDGHSSYSAISDDGRYLVFDSEATNLVAGDTNGAPDIFLHDQQTGMTTRVSVASDGTEANFGSEVPALSGDGNIIVFQSEGSNLVAGDPNGTWDIFVHERLTGITTHASAPSVEADDGSYAPTISAYGRYVAFESDANNLIADDTNDKTDIFIRDQQTKTTSRVSINTNGEEADNHSFPPAALSEDGQYVAFASDATNLVTDDTNTSRDIFVHDRADGSTTRVSVASDGTQADDDSSQPALSADGRYVAFRSMASNLVTGGSSGLQIFVHDRQTGLTTLVAVSSEGVQGNGLSSAPVLSSDGRYVAFESFANNLVPDDTNNADDIFVHDREIGTTVRVSLSSTGEEANDASYAPAFSSDGQSLAFESFASNLVPNDTNGVRDIFVRNFQTGIITRISVASDGTEANQESQAPVLSADARYVAFHSQASNLVAGDTNNQYDIFLHDRQHGLTTRLSVDTGGTQANGASFSPAIPANGQWVVFESYATNLVADDTNGSGDIFLHIIDFAPEVTAITRTAPSPTNAASVTFAVAFAEAVTGVETDDFATTTTGTLTGASVTSVSGAGALYTVTVTLGEGEGTLRLDIPVSATITDLTNQSLVGLPFTAGETYMLDRLVPVVVSITRLDANPTNAVHVDFAITFSESVTGVELNDFTLFTTGSLLDPTMTDLSGGGAVYTLTVETGTGNGTLRLDVPVSASVTDEIGNPLVVLPFLTGEEYLIEKFAEIFLPLVFKP